MNKQFLLKITLLLSLSVASTAGAEILWKAGKIKRILTHSTHFSGCMILMDSTLGHGCASSWVSLDCKGLFQDAEGQQSGKRHFASATAAAHTGKTVRLQVNNNQKANGYCVVRRMDVNF